MDLLKDQSKRLLRKRLIEARSKLKRGDIEQKSEMIAKKLFSLDEISESAVILVYIPVNKEIETKKIVDRLISEDKKLIVPAYSQKNKSYVLSEFYGWQNLEKGPFDILQPKTIKEVALSSIDLAILPGVGFSERGARLGYGKGVFDQLLKGSDAVKIGLAYDLQILDRIPSGSRDLNVDVVISELKVIRRLGL